MKIAAFLLIACLATIGCTKEEKVCPVCPTPVVCPPMPSPTAQPEAKAAPKKSHDLKAEKKK